MANEMYKHKIDDLGRVLLPKELRKAVGWEIGDTLSLCKVSGTIVLSLEDGNVSDVGDNVLDASKIAEGESMS